MNINLPPISLDFKLGDEFQTSYKGYTFTFKKQKTLFGTNMVIVFPKHGDLYCYCNQCSIYQFIQDKEKLGYTCTDMKENII